MGLYSLSCDVATSQISLKQPREAWHSLSGHLETWTMMLNFYDIWQDDGHRIFGDFIIIFNDGSLSQSLNWNLMTEYKSAAFFERLDKLSLIDPLVFKLLGLIDSKHFFFFFYSILKIQSWKFIERGLALLTLDLTKSLQFRFYSINSDFCCKLI